LSLRGGGGLVWGWVEVVGELGCGFTVLVGGSW
jgi:hypothetical protein